ncbi:hypothetical protein DNF23_52905 [Pseudomonas syringae pv. pisi]
MRASKIDAYFRVSLSTFGMSDAASLARCLGHTLTYGAKFSGVSSLETITQHMIGGGDGARGIVFGSYGPGQPGHVFNVVNQNGAIRYLDGQTGKPANMSNFKTLQLLRTN